jgi:fructose-1,6-bisphosphatase/inositol monophosphatase family enzyme
LWDICAPEAIVTAMGGYCADLSGTPIDYSNLADPNVPYFTIAKTKKLWDEIDRRQVEAEKKDAENEKMAAHNKNAEIA